MPTDAERWNRKYRDGAPNFEPDRLLVEHRHLLRGPGRALDVACGVGRNAIYLAECGYESYGIDVSVVGLDIAQSEATRRGQDLLVLAADLDRYPLPVRHFAVVVVSKFLNRGLMPALARALTPGGLLVYQTFNQNFLERRPDFSSDYVLQFGELTRRFAGLEVIATNDRDPGEDSLSFLVARRPLR